MPFRSRREITQRKTELATSIWCLLEQGACAAADLIQVMIDGSLRRKKNADRRSGSPRPRGVEGELGTSTNRNVGGGVSQATCYTDPGVGRRFYASRGQVPTIVGRGGDWVLSAAIYPKGMVAEAGTEDFCAHTGH